MSFARHLEVGADVGLLLGQLSCLDPGSVNPDDVNFIVIDNDTGYSSDVAQLGQHQYPLGLSAAQIRFLTDKREAVEILTQKLKSEGFECTFDLQSKILCAKTLGTRQEDEAVVIMRENLVEMEMPIEMAAMAMLMGDMALPPISGGVGILAVKDGNKVMLVGLADEVKRMNESITKTLRNTIQRRPAQNDEEQSIAVNEDQFAFLQEYRLDALSQSVRDMGAQLTTGKNSIIIKGEKSSVESAVKVVKEKIDGLKTSDLTLLLKIEVLKLLEITTAVAKKQQCTITFHQNEVNRKSTLMTSSKDQRQMLDQSLLNRKRSKVTVIMNALEKQEADVIVNTTNSDLQLALGGGVSSCILQAAGPSIQQEVTEKYPQGISPGEIAESGPGNIKTCKMIFHGSLPYYPKEDTPGRKKQEQQCIKWMVSLVFNCLIKASEKGFRTIALPALGTGALDYPVQQVVQLLYTAIRLYNEDKRSGQIKEVILVIYPLTKLEVKQLFLSHRQTHRLKTCHVASIDQIQKDDNSDKCEVRVKVGETLLQVVNCKVHEACDVTEAVLLHWTSKDIHDQERYLGLKCIDPFRLRWNCAEFVSQFKVTPTIVDRKTLSRRLLVHSYSQGEDDASTVQAMVEGMKAVQGLANTLTIPFANEGRLSKKPKATAKMIIDAIKQAGSHLHVVTVAAESVPVFMSFVTEVSSTFDNKLHPPADINMSVVAVDLWEKTFASKAADSSASVNKLKSLQTSFETILRITSDSQVRILKAKQDLHDKLNAPEYTAC